MTAAPARHPIGSQTNQLREIPLAQLRESPWNPRKHFDPAKLTEMADSLTKGQLTPIIVRPFPSGVGETGLYEIGAGHRRFRAAPQAGLKSLLAVVRDLDDVAFLELLTIENKQRDDIDPLDEAAGYELLMKKAAYDVEKLANRIGLSKDYVYNRLLLLKLIPELKDYLRTRVITAGHGVLLGRLKPTDQKRVMGNPSRMNRYGYHDGTGLFQPEHADHDPEQPGLALKQPIKARSVREVATWINDHVRFKPEENDLPNLFPATAAVLAEAKDEDLAPVYITFDHQLKFDAKDQKTRTYGISSWRRADGKERSRKCDWSRIGIVAAGPSRGEAFRVCVNRDKCEIHFKAARSAAKRRRTEAAKYSDGFAEPGDAGESSWEKQERIRQAKQKALAVRLEKAQPALLEALRTAIAVHRVSSTSALGRFFLNETDTPTVPKEFEKYAPKGTNGDSLVRRVVFATICYHLDDTYDDARGMIEDFRALGVDARKILDEAAPVEKPAPTKPPAKKKGGRK